MVIRVFDHHVGVIPLMQTLEGFWRSTQVLHSWLDTILPGRPCILYTIPAHPPRTVWQKHHLLQQQNYTCLNATLYQNILHASLVYVSTASIFRLDSLPLKCSQEELECLGILFHKPSFLNICYTFHLSWIWFNLFVILNKQKLSLWAFKHPPPQKKERICEPMLTCDIPALIWLCKISKVDMKNILEEEGGLNFPVLCMHHLSI